MDARPVTRSPSGELGTSMAKPALPWLKRLCTLYQRHEPTVYVCSAAAHVSGVLISLEVDRGIVYLLAQPKHELAAYGSTASMSVSMHRPEGADEAPGSGEFVTRQFMDVLRRADKADIRFTSSCLAAAAPDTVVERATSPTISKTKVSQSAQLNWAAFIAQKVLNAPDDCLATLAPPHAFLVKHFETGFTCSEFEAKFGIQPYQAAPAGFDLLVDLGVVSLEDDRVTIHLDSSHDFHLYRSFLFSPAWLDKAKSDWESEYKATVDQSEKLKDLLKP